MGLYIAAIIGLALTNIATALWAIKYRTPASKQMRALKRVIAAFEVEGETVLHITKVSPDNVFLRSPSR